MPCPHAQLRGRTVINKLLWTLFGPCGRVRSQSLPSWIFSGKANTSIHDLGEDDTASNCLLENLLYSQIYWCFIAMFLFFFLLFWIIFRLMFFRVFFLLKSWVACTLATQKHLSTGLLFLIHLNWFTYVHQTNCRPIYYVQMNESESESKQLLPFNFVRQRRWRVEHILSTRWVEKGMSIISTIDGGHNIHHPDSSKLNESSQQPNFKFTLNIFKRVIRIYFTTFTCSNILRFITLLHTINLKGHAQI